MRPSPTAGELQISQAGPASSLLHKIELLEVVQTSSIEPPHGVLAFSNIQLRNVTSGDLRYSQDGAIVCKRRYDNGTPAPIICKTGHPRA